MPDGVEPFNDEIVRALELESLLDLAAITAAGALARTESRGSHFRRDYPARDDAHWLLQTLAYLHEREIMFENSGLDTSLHEPTERTY